MPAYYNENEPFAAEWLRNLIRVGRIAPGDVDERSIVDVRPADLAGYEQCHFFAGIAGWSLALRLAGWPDDQPVWTGSCPCQPFSQAGKQQGFADERHLWPVWHGLIHECRPPVVFGEQVASAIAKGWLDAVFDDLEGAGYACGAAVAPAASVGAPHRRDRLWFVADAGGERRQQVAEGAPRHEGEDEGRAANADNIAERHGEGGRAEDVADADEQGPQERGQSQLLVQREAPLGGGWWESEPDVGRVAHGVPGRVGRLRAYGNAIVPQVAAEFIMAFMAARDAELNVDTSDNGESKCLSV